jgi:hypothetical protein
MSAGYFLTEVTAQKVRHVGASGTRAGHGRVHEGVLAAQPRVGERMVIFRRGGDQMMTSPVRRILVESAGSVAYVMTQNSVYRLTLIGPSAQPANPPQSLQVRMADDGSELTLVEGEPSDEAGSAGRR